MIKIFQLCAAFAILSGLAHAAEPTVATQPTDSSAQPERLNVDLLKSKYWDKGEETELRVVQNRLYKKAHKFEVGAFVGTISTDPFITVKNLGYIVGYHLTEYISLNALGWNSYSNDASALQDLIRGTGRTTNSNKPKGFFGGDFAFSPVYGKLSLLGKAIIHYDMHLALGAGMTSTFSGKYFTPYFGVGQALYLGKYATLRLDYRLMRYHEDVLEQNNIATNGQLMQSRTNFSDVITLGLTFLFGFWN